MRGQTRALTLVTAGKQKTRHNRHYPIEFKLQVLAEAEIRGVAATAKEYGMHGSVIYDWRNGHAGQYQNPLGLEETLTSSRSTVRRSTSLVKASRIPPLAQAKIDLAESNAELTALRERCRQLEWLVGKMVSTHPDLAKFLTGKGPR